MNTTAITTYQHAPWNKGKLIGQKSPLKLKDIWAIRIRLQLANKPRCYLLEIVGAHFQEKKSQMQCHLHNPVLMRSFVASKVLE